jgi:Uma2 family endonuclease
MAIQPLAQPHPTEPTWPPQGHWTYEDYRKLPDDGWRYEVIEGELHMNPAPSFWHQDASINLATEMVNFVKQRQLGKVVTAPIDVKLGDLANPVQPDILFIHQDRLAMIQERWIDGPPDLIVEILLPGNWIDDRRTKFSLYAVSGVREYWIVDPDKRQIEVFMLRRGAYELIGRFDAGERARSEVLPGFEVVGGEICTRP